MRHLLQFAIITVLLTNPALADEKQFIARWTNYDERVQLYDDFGRNFEEVNQLNFNFLPEYNDALNKPLTVRKEIETAFVLYSDEAGGMILLVTPKNNMKKITNLLNEQYRQAMMECADDKSWIVLLPENTWTEVDLNPYCTMAYSEDDILIDLYWTDSSTLPLIDIVTDGLTCVPHQLYGWDMVRNKYRLKSTKCTGSRIVESYSGSGSALKQLF